MAKVIDVDNFLLIRDSDDYIRVMTFMDGIISRKLMNIIREGAKIYLQCDNEETFVGNNHPSFYKCPNDQLELLKEVLIARNFQIVPWEKIQ